MLKNSEDVGEATGSSENIFQWLFGEEPSQAVVEPISVAIGEAVNMSRSSIKWPLKAKKLYKFRNRPDRRWLNDYVSTILWLCCAIEYAWTSTPAMSHAAKRIGKSAINWQKVTERLCTGETPRLASEVNKMKGQNSDLLAQINSLPSELPKVDFDDLKKQLPAYATLIDSLKKQLDAVKISYGEVPKEYNKGIEEWSAYNDTLMKVIDEQTELGTKWCKKIEERWANVPPVEHWYPAHYIQYMPFVYQYFDRRIDNFKENVEENRFFDPASQYINKPETKLACNISARDYKPVNRFETHYENH